MTALQLFPMTGWETEEWLMEPRQDLAPRLERLLTRFLHGSR